MNGLELLPAVLTLLTAVVVGTIIERAAKRGNDVKHMKESEQTVAIIYGELDD